MFSFAGQFELSLEVTWSQKYRIWCGLFCTCIRLQMEYNKGDGTCSNDKIRKGRGNAYASEEDTAFEHYLEWNERK